jgi:hypothetical protein
VSELGLGSDDAAWFLSLLNTVRPGDGMRSIVTKDFVEHVSARKPEKVEEFSAFQKKMTPVSPFSFMPLIEFFLVIAKAATLCNPSSSLETSIREFSFDVTERVQGNPMFRIMRQAAGEDLGSYIELVSGTDTTNFGRNECIKLGTNHYEIINSPKQYPELMRLIVVGYYESLLQIFAVKGKVKVDLDERVGLCVEVFWT